MAAVQRLISLISVFTLLLVTSAWSNAAPLLQRFEIATIAASDLQWVETNTAAGSTTACESEGRFHPNSQPPGGRPPWRAGGTC